MLINSVWKDNISCKFCRFRHPADVTCKEAAEAATTGKLDTVPCKWCEQHTSMTATKMCDRCWELDHRISGDLQLAAIILKHYNEALND